MMGDPYFLTEAEEAALWLADCLAEIAWPIDDEGYLEALDDEAEGRS